MRPEIGIYDRNWMAALHVSVFPRLLFKWPDAVLTILFLEIGLGVEKCETLALPVSQLVILETSPPGERNYISSCDLLAFSLAFRKRGARLPCPTATRDGPLERPRSRRQLQTCWPAPSGL